MITMTEEAFLRFATYNGLFNNISLVNHPEILQAFEQSTNTSTFTIDYSDKTLWPCHEWTIEQERRASIRDHVFEPPTNVASEKTLDEQIMDAVKANDIGKAMMLMAKKSSNV